MLLTDVYLILYASAKWVDFVVRFINGNDVRLIFHGFILRGA